MSHYGLQELWKNAVNKTSNDMEFKMVVTSPQINFPLFFTVAQRTTLLNFFLEIDACKRIKDTETGSLRLNLTFQRWKFSWHYDYVL